LTVSGLSLDENYEFNNEFFTNYPFSSQKALLVEWLSNRLLKPKFAINGPNLVSNKEKRMSSM
jgi:hypothetical protein